MANEATINNRLESARKVDAEKLAIEASVVPKIKRIFANYASDAAALYLTTGNIPAAELAHNYAPEFLKEIRDAMRKSIKYFGFNLRDKLQKNFGFFFDVEFKRDELDLCFKKLVRIDDPSLDDKLNQINNEFARQVTIFVANQSEFQTRFVTDTNAKDIIDAVRQEEENFRRDIQAQAAKINDLVNQPIGEEIQRQIDKARAELAAQQADAQAIISKNIKANLLDRSQARSDLIAAQNVGLAESWSKQTEGEIIHGAKLADATGRTAQVQKTWTAILDTKTRASHAAADSQKVTIDESFQVGGESLKYPRDPNGSAGNVINCRCLSQQTVEMS